jgi:undecaprenyl pyrophosphate phosphatase UppP
LASAIRGLTEFLPISSKTHLLFAEQLFKIVPSGECLSSSYWEGLLGGTVTYLLSDVKARHHRVVVHRWEP